MPIGVAAACTPLSRGARPRPDFSQEGLSIATPPGQKPNIDPDTESYPITETDPGVFYGWLIVGVSALVFFSSGPGQSFVFSVFIDSIISATDLSRSEVSGLYVASTVASGLLVGIVSRMSDRFGSRTVLVVVGLAFGAACFGMATATNLALFYLAFASLRALGQGSLTINAILLVNQWFVTRRGRAIAIMGLGGMLSTAAFPPLARTLIDTLGWREAYAILGVVAIVLIVPAALFLVRNKPEDMGLFPDGAPRPPRVETRQSPSPTPGSRRILRSFNFWLLALPLATPGLISTALVFHQTSIFQEHGLSATWAAGVFVIFAAASATSSMVSGFLVDRTGPKVLFGFSMAVLILGLLLAILINSAFVAVVYVLVMGVAGGSYMVVQGVIWAHYYGRYRLGEVQGSAMMISICGSAIGPLPLALFHDLTGTYTLGMLAMMALPVISLISLWSAHPNSPARLREVPVG